MFNKELLRYRRQGKNVLPLWVDENDLRLQELAAELLNVYAVGFANQLNIGVLTDMCESIISGVVDRKLAAGLNKVILDKLEFSAPPQVANAVALREELFALSGSLLRGGGAPKEYFAQLQERCRELNMSPENIYADLPENEILMSYEPFTAVELLRRYNMVLVQSLILNAERLVLEINGPEAGEMRQFFRYLKFFRLLPESVSLAEEQGEYKFELGGALSIFEGVRKYALNLAAIIPAVCKFKKYKVAADLVLGENKLSLKFDESSKLFSYYRNSGNYVPEEIKIFAENFDHAHGGRWRIMSAAETPYCRLTDGRLIFPDLSFVDLTGRLIYFEIFHAWHASQLCERLEYVLNNPDFPLLIGVERGAKLSESWQYRLDNEPELQRRVLRFRNYPGAERVLRLLNGFEE
ncbi:MAG: DUF790 family protein [Lentisphaeria bacterium]|nr:DUF790 family protein [Lentisphaeria bacterium]